MPRSGGPSSPLPEPGAVRDRWESLQALVALADDLAEQEPSAGLAQFVAELEERGAAQHAPTVQGVTLASLHAAKGLEWDAVLLVGLSEGLMPISLAEGWEAVEEERRLLYVGVTRAREHLYLSWSRSRRRAAAATGSPRASSTASSVTTPSDRGARRGADGAGGQRRRRRPRRPPPAVPAPPRSPRAAERKVGRCGTCPPTYDEAVFERLREWRSRTAAEAKVPRTSSSPTPRWSRSPRRCRPTSAGSPAVPGVGPAKLDRYGEQVLALLTDA